MPTVHGEKCHTNQVSVGRIFGRDNNSTVQLLKINISDIFLFSLKTTCDLYYRPGGFMTMKKTINLKVFEIFTVLFYFKKSHSSNISVGRVDGFFYKK